MPSNPDDIALMQRLSAGDDLALNALMSRWKDRVGAFLYRYIGDHETAVDLTQETFVRLYTSRKKYKPTGAFSTYLFHIAANLARSHSRWKRRHPSIPLEAEDGTLIHEPVDPKPTPAAAAIIREKTSLTQKAMASLPHDQREALLLSILEEMSHAQIATVQGCSEKAVEVRIYRARQSLKEALAAYSA